ncbi:MAG: reactive intermediate/imine deaminase [Legionellales bacterium]|nr:reactive intermediate/imine deaminase [Legionellales bacterium]|tara:strand:- start:48786 stop:49196 length:411 start_codon:yes stop_codon:yes gene_type:complete
MSDVHVRKVINTSSAPEAIGTYSQAVKVGDTVYISGQIPLVPETGKLIQGGFAKQVQQAFDNLKAVCDAAGGSLRDIVKLNIYLTDMAHFPVVNEVMGRYFLEPYPARAALGVKSLPKDAQVEMDAIMVLHQTLEF